MDAALTVTFVLATRYYGVQHGIPLCLLGSYTPGPLIPAHPIQAHRSISYQNFLVKTHINFTYTYCTSISRNDQYYHTHLQ